MTWRKSSGSIRVESAVEHNRHLTALGGCRSSRHQRAVSSLALNVRTQLCDCVPNAQSMACARYANILQQLIVNLSEQINIDVVGLEGVGILAKAVRLQPFPDLAHALSCSSSAFASFRSSVSKPSLNRP